MFEIESSELAVKMSNGPTQTFATKMIVLAAGAT
jgi:predicted outer membrane protein